MMKLNLLKPLPYVMCIAALSWSTSALSHGDVVPQAIDATALKQLGEELLEVNPYVGNAKAFDIGQSGYAQNCARCHGLEAVSGGIAPDLRELPNGEEGDMFFIERMRNGAIRNGITYMPKFEGIISQEAMWSIRAWLQSISVETVEAAAKNPAPVAAVAVKTASTETKPVAPKPAVAQPEAPKQAAPKPEVAKPEPPKQETAKPETPKQEAAQPEAKPATPKQEANPEPAKQSKDSEEAKPQQTAVDLNAPPTRLQQVMQKGMLEVAVYNNFPPYSYVEKGKPKGIDVDIAKELAKRLGISHGIRLVGADENVGDDLRNNVWKGHYLGGGVADVMLHMPVDKAFAKENDLVSFVAPYQLEQITFAVDTKKLGEESTLANFIYEPIGVELDTLSDFYLLRALSGKITNNVKHFSSVSEAMQALKDGKVAGVMAPRGEIEGTLPNRPDHIKIRNIVTPGLSRASWAMGLAVKARNKDLTNALAKAMADMVNDGAVKTIFEQYNVAYNPPSAAPKQ